MCAGEGSGVAEGVVANAEGVVAVAVGFGFARVLSAAPWVGVFRGAGARVLTLALVRSRPVRSMATHAVADTPATATSQIAAMAIAERGLTTMLTLCPLGAEQA